MANPQNLVPIRDSARARELAARRRGPRVKPLHVVAELSALAVRWRSEKGERLSMSLARRVIGAALDPADPNSWRALELLLKLDPEYQDALRAAAHVDSSGATPRIIIDVGNVQPALRTVEHEPAPDNAPQNATPAP